MKEVDVPLQDGGDVLNQTLVVEDLDRLRVRIVVDLVRTLDQRGVLPTNTL